MDGRDVFFHTPAKSMLQERAQEAVLRKCGAYQPLELCYQASKPWGRFFIFDKDFVAYNRAGMQAEDGIRDVERSRGLGDVYKRQDKESSPWLAGLVAKLQRLISTEFAQHCLLRTLLQH